MTKDQEELLKRAEDEASKWVPESKCNLTITELCHELRAVLEENERMRDVLIWYSDPGNYTYDDNGNCVSTAWENNKLGNKALECLASLNPPKTDQSYKKDMERC